MYAVAAEAGGAAGQAGARGYVQGGHCAASDQKRHHPAESGHLAAGDVVQVFFAGRVKVLGASVEEVIPDRLIDPKLSEPFPGTR